MYELMAAAKLLLTAPQSTLSADRMKIEAKLGRPLSVGTDLIPGRHGEDTTDRVVTLDWPDIRVRLFEVPSARTVALLGVTVTTDVLRLDTPVRIGVDRGTVLRALGGPAFEDEDQVVYSLQQESGALPNATVRIVFKDDRVVGIDWTYPVE